MKIKTLIPLSIAIALGIVLGLNIFANKIHDKNHHTIDKIGRQADRSIILAHSIHVNVKTQVQEWKNILLRADKPDLYKKHLKALAERERKVQKETNELLRHFEYSPNIKEQLAGFLLVHKEVSTQYHIAIKRYNFIQQQKEVDALVLGTDRKLSRLIDDIVTLIEKEAEEKVEAAVLVMARKEQLTNYSEIVGAFMVLIFLMWLLDRLVSQPVSSAMTLASRISSGDLSTPVEINRYGEVGELLSALHNMQLKLAEHQHGLEILVKSRTQELTQSNEHLQQALHEIKTLKGILPLCSFCKKIRNDSNEWEEVDTYIYSHSEAEISHGICPECAQEHYPEEYNELYPKE